MAPLGTSTRSSQFANEVHPVAYPTARFFNANFYHIGCFAGECIRHIALLFCIAVSPAFLQLELLGRQPRHSHDTAFRRFFAAKKVDQADGARHRTNVKLMDAVTRRNLSFRLLSLSSFSDWRPTPSSELCCSYYAQNSQHGWSFHCNQF
jgi:hypothetical protein